MWPPSSFTLLLNWGDLERRCNVPCSCDCRQRYQSYSVIYQLVPLRTVCFTTDRALKQVCHSLEWQCFLPVNITFIIVFFWHWAGDFRMYDFGASHNMRLYHDTRPPAYNLRKISVPIAIFWSQNDWLAQKEVSINSSSRSHQISEQCTRGIYT